MEREEQTLLQQLVCLKTQKTGRKEVAIGTVFGHQGPANLLIHGFDAFLEHYRDDIHSISKMRTELGYHIHYHIHRDDHMFFGCLFSASVWPTMKWKHSIQWGSHTSGRKSSCISLPD
ncbi:hypothetical protein DKX38_023114 [Salix brachista]|uniref:Uncharacterized protein n=1 Tax=Salix brachista TaxID=2182728 RepID=A0A5N5K702_9ROSI|nr:hypothetical protein DKX38_023114 [Salix brachista]